MRFVRHLEPAHIRYRLALMPAASFVAFSRPVLGWVKVTAAARDISWWRGSLRRKCLATLPAPIDVIKYSHVVMVITSVITLTLISMLRLLAKMKCGLFRC